jgi:hypothetical protein
MREEFEFGLVEEDERQWDDYIGEAVSEKNERPGVSAA